MTPPIQGGGSVIDYLSPVNSPRQFFQDLNQVAYTSPAWAIGSNGNWGGSYALYAKEIKVVGALTEAMSAQLLDPIVIFFKGLAACGGVNVYVARRDKTVMPSPDPTKFLQSRTGAGDTALVSFTSIIGAITGPADTYGYSAGSSAYHSMLLNNAVNGLTLQKDDYGNTTASGDTFAVDVVITLLAAGTLAFTYMQLDAILFSSGGF